MRELNRGPCGPEKKDHDSVMHASEDILAAPPEAVVCYCSGVTKGEILRAIAGGAQTLADIRARTGACTVARCAEMSPRRR